MPICGPPPATLVVPTCDGPRSPVTVQFDLAVAGGDRIGYLMTGTEVVAGWLPDPWVRIRDELAALAHAVWGSADVRSAAGRELRMKDEPGPAVWSPDDAWLGARDEATRAAYQVIRALAPSDGDLASLAVRFGSDKWGSHWYTPHYERHLGAYRDQRVRVLEIGIGGYFDPAAGGASLRMWKHYFRRGMVYGLDVYDKSGIDEPRLVTLRGDQSNREFLTELAGKIGPFDIVIDDGSHVSSDVLATFGALFPYVRPGGVYVVEDLHTSYWPGWGGNDADRADPATSVGFLKTLIDGLHHRDLIAPGPAPATVAKVTGVHFYHNVAFVEAGRNAEQGPASWRPRNNPMAKMPTPPTGR